MKSISKTIAFGILVALVAGTALSAYAADSKRVLNQQDKAASNQIGK